MKVHNSAVLNAVGLAPRIFCCRLNPLAKRVQWQDFTSILNGKPHAFISICLTDNLIFFLSLIRANICPAYLDVAVYNTSPISFLKRALHSILTRREKKSSAAYEDGLLQLIVSMYSRPEIVASSGYSCRGKAQACASCGLFAVPDSISRVPCISVGFDLLHKASTDI